MTFAVQFLGFFETSQSQYVNDIPSQALTSSSSTRPLVGRSAISCTFLVNFLIPSVQSIHSFKK